MKKYELPCLIIVCSILLGYIIGLNLLQGMITVAFIGATYWSGRRVKA